MAQAKKPKKKGRVRISQSRLSYPIAHIQNEWKRLNRRLKSSNEKGVYFILGNKAYRYPHRKYCDGFSRILYIGRTDRRNAARPLESLARKAEMCFDSNKNITRLDVAHITVKGRKGRADVGRKLENACLEQFDTMFRDLPYANGRGADKVKIDYDTFEKDTAYFGRERIMKILLKIGDPRSKKND